MEVPRLDHHRSSPSSPCEDVIKNLSLEAIQLCERDDMEHTVINIDAQGKWERLERAGIASFQQRDDSTSFFFLRLLTLMALSGGAKTA
uniref:Uncharacterized protein n=1 Tax=Sphaerodactylus townsendi TaxID=933632 RepID=A0ACB8F873_9SAUR